jgi:hypothetical protein
MATVVFEYNENDRTANGMFGAIATIPGIKAFFSGNRLTGQKSKEENAIELLERAKRFDASIKKQNHTMPMAEIVQEVRDYRNGK